MSNKNQQPLFDLDAEDREYMPRGPFVPWTEYGEAKKLAVAISPEIGPHVGVQERREALLATLGHLAHASKMHGFSAAVHTPRRQELRERYGNDLHDLTVNAEIAERQSNAEARSEFRRAYGYKQMVEYSDDPAKTSEEFADIYDKFQDIYVGSKGNTARKKLQRRLEKAQAHAQYDYSMQRAVRKHLAGGSSK